MKIKVIISVLAGMLFLVGSVLGQSIRSGIIITANSTGWSAVHFLPGAYEWEVYAPGKTITGKVHADTNFQVNILPGVFYTSTTSIEMVAGNPQETVSVWFNTDENQEHFQIYDPVGNVVIDQEIPPGPKGGFVVVGTFGSLKMKKGNTYYGNFISQIFPLSSPSPTPCPCP